MSAHIVELRLSPLPGAPGVPKTGGRGGAVNRKETPASFSLRGHRRKGVHLVTF